MIAVRSGSRRTFAMWVSLAALLGSAGTTRAQVPWGELGAVIEGAAKAADRFGFGMSAAYTSYKSLRIERRYQRGEIDHEQRLDAHYRLGFGFLGGLGGGTLGATGGAVLGSTLGPPGTLLGGLVGGFCGACLGERAATRHAGRFRKMLRQGAELVGTTADRFGERIHQVRSAIKQSRPVQALCRIGSRGKTTPPP